MRAARPWQGGSSRPRASLQVLAGLGAPWGMYLRALTINTHAGRCQGASLVAQLVKSLPAAQGARAPSLGPEDPPRAKWQPLQDSWLQNPADRGARRAAGHGSQESDRRPGLSEEAGAGSASGSAAGLVRCLRLGGEVSPSVQAYVGGTAPTAPAERTNTRPRQRAVGGSAGTSFRTCQKTFKARG